MSSRIPNVIHFCYGFKKQTEEFSFVSYISIYSAHLINAPDKIYIYYHYEPKGKWWERAKVLAELVHVGLPEYIGSKKIIRTAHRADILRMNVLHEKGGVYMDIDTICIRPYKQLLTLDSCVLGWQLESSDICNAIMFSEARSSFFKIWLDEYEARFRPAGWDESSIKLPAALAKKHPDLLTVLPPATFFRPKHADVSKIFKDECKQIPKELITLHLWSSSCPQYGINLMDITGWEWASKNSHTLYGKILSNLHSQNGF